MSGRCGKRYMGFFEEVSCILDAEHKGACWSGSQWDGYHRQKMKPLVLRRRPSRAQRKAQRQAKLAREVQG